MKVIRQSDRAKTGKKSPSAGVSRTKWHEGKRSKQKRIVNQTGLIHRAGFYDGKNNLYWP